MSVISDIPMTIVFIKKKVVGLIFVAWYCEQFKYHTQNCVYMEEYTPKVPGGWNDKKSSQVIFPLHSPPSRPYLRLSTIPQKVDVTLFFHFHLKLVVPEVL